MRSAKWSLASLMVLAILIPLTMLAQTGFDKVSPFGYRGQASGIKVIVDTEPAAWQGKSKFIPLVIFVGSEGAQSITLNQAAFTLTDPSGKVLPMAPYDVIKDKKNYGDFNVANDYTFIKKTIEAGPDAQSFNGLGYQPGLVCFYPNVGPGGQSMIRDTAELRPNAFGMFLAYFANPVPKAKGTYKLTYTDPATKGVVTVPFEIKWR
jgi:hypothetical protein